MTAKQENRAKAEPEVNQKCHSVSLRFMIVTGAAVAVCVVHQFDIIDKYLQETKTIFVIHVKVNEINKALYCIKSYFTRLTSLATQHVASDVIFFGTSMVFLDLKGVG